MTVTANGLRVIEGTITETVTGVWRAQLSVDTDQEQTAVAIDLDGVSLVGTVLRQAVDGGTNRMQIVAGAGTLSTDDSSPVLSAKAYQSTSLGTVLQDILLATGEALASDSDDLSGNQVGTWQRVAGPARSAIEALAAKAGLNWRVTRAGELWLGTDTWEETSAAPIQVASDLAAGTYDLRDARELRPGQTYAGAQIRQCRHDCATSGTEARVRGTLGMFDQKAELLRREIRTGASWAATVLSQHSDGTLELQPDNATVAGAGIDRVPITPGLAGCELEVPAGSRCYFTFADQDLSKPVVTGWEHGTAVTLISLAGGAQYAALANLVDDRIAAIVDFLNNTLVLSTPVGPTGPGAVTPLPAQASVECAQVKIT